MYKEIGAFDAKAKLSQILQKVKQGERFTITIRGEPVADLVPTESVLGRDVHAAVNAMLSIKKVKGVSRKTINEWIGEGRR